MMKEYITPDFDVTVYEVEEVITTSSYFQIGQGDPNGNLDDWFG